jgi:hypothetical protein
MKCYKFIIKSKNDPIIHRFIQYSLLFYRLINLAQLASLSGSAWLAPSMSSKNKLGSPEACEPLRAELLRDRAGSRASNFFLALLPIHPTSQHSYYLSQKTLISSTVLSIIKI